MATKRPGRRWPVNPTVRALLAASLVVAVPIIVLILWGPGPTFWISFGGSVIGAALGVVSRTSKGRRWLDDPTTRLFLPVTVLSVALPVVAFVLWGTGLVFRGVAGPCAIGIVIGVVVLIDRWRAPLRNIYRAPAIGSERDFRDVAFQVDRLLERGDFMRAYTATVAICTWLKGEQHFGSKHRQQRLAAALDNWTARRGEYDKRAELV